MNEAIARKQNVVEPIHKELCETRGVSRLMLMLALALGAFSVSLALLIGNIGFEGDDWWEFSWSYWFPFPQSIWEYAKESSRPIEGIYGVLSFDTFGLNRLPYTLTSLFLAAGSCLLLANCLKRAFPEKSAQAILAAFLAFFLTPVSNLTYMIHTDNSRISMLFFWCSVFAFQDWAASGSPWKRMILPAVLYLLGAFTYENTTFLIFCIPFFLWPVYLQDPKKLSRHKFLIRLFVCIFVSFAIFLLTRFFILSGGAVKQSSLIPPAGLVWSYVANLGYYCIYPVIEISRDPVSWLWAFPVALVLSVFLYHCAKSVSNTGSKQRAVPWEQRQLYVLILGSVMTVFGTIPYLMAGYNPDIGFTSQSRVYSAASFGLAIVLAGLFTAPYSSRLRIPVRILAVASVLLMAVFLADLRKEWQQAEVERSEVCRSLLNEAPQVEPKTTFLFMGLQSYIYRHGVAHAVIYQGVDGLGEWIKMLYGRKDVYAYFIYPRAEMVNDDKGRLAYASPSGFEARGSIIRGKIPLDTILIFEKHRNKMKLLDSLSEKDNVAAIKWDGISEIQSNMNRILTEATGPTGLKSICRP
ncbi:MAG: hypothetical protein ACP5U1_07450 [Desulfomonilaceae bacterium]